ncbi:MAG: SH3 domain-containing protein [Anaerolineae bacterium]|jgi:hypothetical protein|nr:SH3 domain-containing protein [Anaerolineae bacterium]
MHARTFSLIGLLLLIITTGCTLSLVGSSDADNTPTPAVLPGQPEVEILPRLDNATYREGVLMYILATVRNAGANIARVEVLVDGIIVAQRDNPNVMNETTFTIQETWLATGTGERTITVAVSRANGERGEDSINVLVTNEGLALAPIITEAPNQNVVTVVENTPQVIPTSQLLTVPTQGGEATLAPTAAPTEVVIDPNAPRIFADAPANVRRGPSRDFDPPLGVLQAGDSAPILALNQAGDWLKISYQGGEAWVFGEVVRIEGDTTNLPRESGPAVPTPTS